MNSTELEKIPVEQLTLGMVIHGIGEQEGKLVVKNIGKVRHLKIIEQLAQHGVKSVIIERLVAISNESLEKLNQKKQALHQARKLKSDAKSSGRATVLSDLSIELKEASKLINQGASIHSRYTKTLQSESHIDVSEAQALVHNVYESLARNPNALLCLSMIMHSYDYLANHAIHVAILMCHFAQHQGMSEHDCERMALLGYLFDIGMVKVPREILNKPQALNEQEQARVRTHVQHSLNILSPLKLDSEIMLAVEQHHERLNGLGYPRASLGSNISKFSRILAIVDSYDAITTNRPHQTAKTPASAMKILSTPEHGYDQKLVLQFIRSMGIYPVGSLVMLSNKRIGLVLKCHPYKPSLPEIKIFYSVSGGHYLEPSILNMATYTGELKIIKPVLACQFNLDLEKIL